MTGGIRPQPTEFPRSDMGLILSESWCWQQTMATPVGSCLALPLTNLWRAFHRRQVVGHRQRHRA